MNFPVIDLHCDTVLALLGDDMNQAGSLRKNDFHIDLERASRLGGYAQCFACFTTPFMEKYHHVSPVVAFEREIATLQREMDRNKDLISIAYSPKEIEENRKNGKMSAILTLEGTAGIGYDPELLSSLWLIGFRISSLGWNEKNPLTGSHETGGGLTDQGRAYVREAQRLGMLIDVSHISDEGFWDIMDITQAPIVATHSNSRAVWNNSRNLTDDMFRAIAQTGAWPGITSARSSPGRSPPWTPCATTFFILWSLTPAESILPWAAIWTELPKCPPDLRAFRAGLPLPGVCWNTGWGKKRWATFSGTMPLE